MPNPMQRPAALACSVVSTIQSSTRQATCNTTFNIVIEMPIRA
ncbi:hypothetical protein GcM3_126018 [Golovinomyces cichoracearum]|uniref:Uncharacterized protein n=1 Tax=Golovinomyces cichoracearum TaxID=62708 RepID=A0A420I611_9PEZI|nr:hypothetical protein GcM3_126018 [Golovinomyces cichoracearum]